MTDRELACAALIDWAREQLCDNDDREIDLDERLLVAVTRACAVAREEGRKEKAHGPDKSS